jgi:hypothetical protein
LVLRLCALGGVEGSECRVDAVAGDLAMWMPMTSFPADLMLTRNGLHMKKGSWV